MPNFMSVDYTFNNKYNNYNNCGEKYVLILRELIIFQQHKIHLVVIGGDMK